MSIINNPLALGLGAGALTMFSDPTKPAGTHTVSQRAAPGAQGLLTDIVGGNQLMGSPGMDAAMQAAWNKINPMVDSQFASSGRYNSGLAQQAKAEGLGNAFAGLYNQNLDRQLQAAQLMGVDESSPIYHNALGEALGAGLLGFGLAGGGLGGLGGLGGSGDGGGGSGGIPGGGSIIDQIGDFLGFGGSGGSGGVSTGISGLGLPGFGLNGFGLGDVGGSSFGLDALAGGGGVQTGGGAQSLGLPGGFDVFGIGTDSPAIASTGFQGGGGLLSGVTDSLGISPDILAGDMAAGPTGGFGGIFDAIGGGFDGIGNFLNANPALAAGAFLTPLAMGFMSHFTEPSGRDLHDDMRSSVLKAPVEQIPGMPGVTGRRINHGGQTLYIEPDVDGRQRLEFKVLNMPGMYLDPFTGRLVDEGFLGERDRQDLQNQTINNGALQQEMARQAGGFTPGANFQYGGVPQAR